MMVARKRQYVTKVDFSRFQDRFRRAISSIQAGLSGLRIVFEKRLSGLERRFGGLETRVGGLERGQKEMGDRMEERFDKLERLIDGFAGTYKKVDEEQEIIAHRQSAHADTLENHEQRITALEGTS